VARREERLVRPEVRNTQAGHTVPLEPDIPISAALREPLGMLNAHMAMVPITRLSKTNRTAGVMARSLPTVNAPFKFAFQRKSKKRVRFVAKMGQLAAPLHGLRATISGVGHLALSPSMQDR
jgi:hypothetical protein